MILETAEEVAMAPLGPILRLFFGKLQIAHPLGVVVPEQGAMMQPAVLRNVLGIAAAFLVA